jgi:hypothetical protein
VSIILNNAEKINTEKNICAKQKGHEENRGGKKTIGKLEKEGRIELRRWNFIICKESYCQGDRFRRR